MIKRFFKKHNKKIIAFIGVLTLTICGVLGITKTYAYTYDETTDTITSDNLFNIKDLNTNLNISINNDYSFSISSLNTSNIFTTSIQFEANTQYTFKFNLTYQVGNSRLIIYYTDNSIENVIPTAVTNNAIFTTASNKTISSIGASYGNTGSATYEYLMIIKGTTAPSSYEPYGTYINKNEYDSLENGFEFLQQEYLNLLDEYEQLVNNYATLNTNYTNLLNDYNTLNTNYTNLQAQFDNLARNNQRLTNELNTLQNEYDQLLEDYNELINTDTNGLWAYFGGFSIGYVDNNNTWQTLEAYQTFEDFKNSQYNYLDGISINLSNLKTRYPNYDKFTFACQGSGTPLLLNALSYKINNDGNTTQNGIVLESFANTIQIDYTNLIQMQFKVNYQNIYDNLGFYDENKRVSILLFTIEYDNSNNFEITSLNNEYNYGYITGYQNGRDSLNSTINSLNDNIDRLNEQVANQQSIINDLNYQINAINNQYGLNNLMWTIGGLPFESFKHIWNVNFFGINIADFILGFVTTFIGIYILKKFFF